jgi:hypothetical protein
MWARISPYGFPTSSDRHRWAHLGSGNRFHLIVEVVVRRISGTWGVDCYPSPFPHDFLWERSRSRACAYGLVNLCQFSTITTKMRTGCAGHDLDTLPRAIPLCAACTDCTLA